jgi:glycerophosphoryl diester phosphodiesterase
MKKVFCILSLATTMFINAQTQIIAHRGFWNTQPKTSENSIQSLENAQKLKIYGSEFDIHMTKDGKLVINHDEYHGKMEISETDFSDLKTKIIQRRKTPNPERLSETRKMLPSN